MYRNRCQGVASSPFLALAIQMAEFITEQADFILFFYGLAFILLGITCFAIARTASEGVAWFSLGSFGLIHGISEWLDLSALVIGDTHSFAALRTAVM